MLLPSLYCIPLLLRVFDSWRIRSIYDVDDRLAFESNLNILRYIIWKPSKLLNLISSHLNVYYIYVGLKALKASVKTSIKINEIRKSKRQFIEKTQFPVK